MDIVEVKSKIRKTVYDELRGFFVRLFGRDQAKLLTQADIDLVIAKVGDALEQKLDLAPSSGAFSSAQNELRSFFSKLFGGKTQAVVGRTGLEGTLESAAGAVEQKVLQELESAKFIDDLIRRTVHRAYAAAGVNSRETTTPQAAANAAVGRLRNAGRWPATFDDSGLPAVFAAAAKSTAVVTFSEGGVVKQRSPLELLERFMEWLSGRVSPQDIENAGLAARRRGTVPLPAVESHGARVDYSSVLLAEEAQERASKKRIDFSQALHEVQEERAWEEGVRRFDDAHASRGIQVDRASVRLDEAARERASKRGIDFGQALRELQEEGFSRRS